MIIKDHLRGKHFISIHDFSAEDILHILEVGAQLKARQKNEIPHKILEGKTLGMIFQKSSTRTRVAFEVGMYQLGGHALFLSPRDIQIGRGETIKDTAQVLSRMVDGIMIRTFDHDEVIELAKWSCVPVINGLTDLLHPTQIIGDLMTIQEYKDELEGLKCAFIGDGNNVANSLLFGGAKVGMNITIATPEGFEPNDKVLTSAKEDALETGAKLEVIEDPFEAARNADVIYTDVWASMGQEDEADEKENKFKKYQINDHLLSYAKEDAIVLHCLPAKRGKEITNEVMDGPKSVVFEEAENRLHAHKAIMAVLM
ncbi:Ornithine carbamoyltransferase [Candidatus Syntrophocurvum alkaliphilum]|uniref:Ornithine carbamoyltransferase n=1 Tax=Candidatus Syntrophocurvum alkaliphilum TaxID=2293317 RepID=A0A6I6DED7_9FIRM|nr:ornithine carbamoyltransferase [Candidatus Syntrophocurvum alkaliphilum]QGU00822.1 Ornithine carbamoyltransferase [Candidatus Syntrophocurvum alkaliphilum]